MARTHMLEQQLEEIRDAVNAAKWRALHALDLAERAKARVLDQAVDRKVGWNGEYLVRRKQD